MAIEVQERHDSLSKVATIAQYSVLISYITATTTGGVVRVVSLMISFILTSKRKLLYSEEII